MADISFITSIIGGGKSLNGTRIVCDELENGDRMISTSLPLFLDDHWVTIKRTRNLRPPPGIPDWWESPYAIQDVDELDRPLKSDSMRMFIFGLATWCHYEIKKPVDFNQRLRLLKHDEISKFYLHVPNRDLPELQETLPGRKPVSVPDLTARNGDGGCVFIIDEIHNYFSARNYLEAGPGVERYQSQLRKLNDDMWMISQHLEKVDKNFRRNATRTFEMRNMSKQKLWVGVTLKERFDWAQYPGIPSKNDKPTEKGHFMLRERGMCWLYDTMAGVGVTGGMKADQPPKGRHWSTWIFVALLIAGVGFVFPRLMMHGFGFGVGHMLGSFQTGIKTGFGKQINKGKTDEKTEQNQGAGVSETATQRRGTEIPFAQEQPQVGSPSALNETFCTGYIKTSHDVLAFLSDGTTLSVRAGQIIAVHPDYLWSTTGKYKVHRAAIVPVLGTQNYQPPVSVSQQSPFVQSQNDSPSYSVSVTIIGQSYLQARSRFHSSGFHSRSFADSQMSYQNDQQQPVNSAESVQN